MFNALKYVLDSNNQSETLPLGTSSFNVRLRIDGSNELRWRVNDTGIGLMIVEEIGGGPANIYYVGQNDHKANDITPLTSVTLTVTSLTNETVSIHIMAVENPQGTFMVFISS